MVWPLLLMAGVSAAQSITGGVQQRGVTKSQNRETAKTNRLNTLEAFQGVSAIEVQRGNIRQQTAKNLNLAGRMADQATSTTTAAAAAAGVKGASVDAVVDDIQRESAEVRTELEQQHVAQEYNLNQRIRELMTSTEFNLGSLQKVPSMGSIVAGGVMSGALTAASSYAGAYFKFGSTGSMNKPT